MRDAEWVRAGLAVLLKLPDGAPDVQIVREAMTYGMIASAEFKGILNSPSTGQLLTLKALRKTMRWR
jgi:hypothetical protein